MVETSYPVAAETSATDVTLGLTEGMKNDSHNLGAYQATAMRYANGKRVNSSPLGVGWPPLHQNWGTR